MNKNKSLRGMAFIFTGLIMVVPLGKPSQTALRKCARHSWKWTLPALRTLDFRMQPALSKVFPSLLTGRKVGDAGSETAFPGAPWLWMSLWVCTRAGSRFWVLCSVWPDAVQLLPWAGGGRRKGSVGSRAALQLCQQGGLLSLWASCLNSYRVCRIG